LRTTSAWQWRPPEYSICQLAGEISSGSLRAKAERVTQSIEGVYEIDNRIVSVPNRGRPRPDNVIPNV
jgi:hypothetical protein